VTSGASAGDDARRAAELAARRSYGKLVAYLSARTRDVTAAEDALAGAFEAALSDWPRQGVPERPEAWLMAVAQRKAIDAVRRRQSADGAADHLKLMAEELAAMADEGGEIPDDRLRLMFVCAHPAIDESARAPLMLQTILGIDAARIADAFLVPPATMGQRLVRAKAKIKRAGIPFRIPERAAFAERLETVLAAIYAVFAEGWSDPAGSDARRRDLASEAIWLGRLVVTLMPDEPEGLGLLALMLHAEARRGARRSEAGAYVPLGAQDPARWDDAMIDEAETLLRQASQTGATGRYQLEAAVQSAHVVRRLTGRADWQAIARIYDLLLKLTDSPVVAVNRAVAIAEVDGPAAGIAALDDASSDPRLGAYQPYFAARANLLARAGDRTSADAAYARAIALEHDPAVKQFLENEKRALAGEGSITQRR
jgi:RNA polymerase sigma-70 factor (ECF subfamily)